MPGTQSARWRRNAACTGYSRWFEQCGLQCLGVGTVCTAPSAGTRCSNACIWRGQEGQPHSAEATPIADTTAWQQLLDPSRHYCADLTLSLAIRSPTMSRKRNRMGVRSPCSLSECTRRYRSTPRSSSAWDEDTNLLNAFVDICNRISSLQAAPGGTGPPPGHRAPRDKKTNLSDCICLREPRL